MKLYLIARIPWIDPPKGVLPVFFAFGLLVLSCIVSVILERRR